MQWHQALRRSATLLEPAWPKGYSAGPFTHTLPTVALVLYAGSLDGEPEEIAVGELVAALTPRPVGSSAPSIEDVVGRGLTELGHELDDDSPLSRLFRQLTENHPPLAYSSTGWELTAADHWPGGTLMKEAARVATHYLTYYHLGATESA